MKNSTLFHTPLRLIPALLLLLFAACEKKLQPASYIIVDPVRHYYPVIQGQMLDVTYEIENTSDHPLFIQEIQTSCGCIVPRDELPVVVLPHKSNFIRTEFNSIKNSGFVSHNIYLYGNFKDTTCVELQFDTNVVPRPDYVRDYEQLYMEQSKSSNPFHGLVGGGKEQKGYFTN